MGRLTGRIWKRGDRWQVIIVVGHDPRGNERRKYYTCSSEQEAKELHAKLMSQVYAGTYTEPTKQTLADFAQQWLRDYAEVNLRPTTYNNYEVSLRCHALPVIGGVVLSSVRPPDIQRVLADCKRKGLAPKTTKHVYTALHRLFGQAVAWGLLSKNPCEAVNPPKVPRKEPPAWSKEQAQRFLVATREHRLFAFFYLALATGMRRGELLGLTWRDVEFADNRLVVRRAAVPVKGKMTLGGPKTPSSWRNVSLGAQTMGILRRHRDLVDSEGGDLPFWNALDLVFPSEAGHLLEPTTVRRVMKRCIKEADLPHIPLHGLRHTCATIMLRQGVHPKVAAERLGHSDVGITLNTYSHTQDDLQREAAATLDGQLVADWLQHPENETSGPSRKDR